MKCLVTGAAGFVGSTLSEALIEKGHTVTGVDCFVEYYPKAAKLRNLDALSKNASFRFVEANLATTDLAPLTDGVDWIFHQAGQAGVRASWGEYYSTYVEHNILATQKILEKAKTLSNLKKIVFASSSSVYGNAEAFPTSEKVVPQPVSPYGVTKLAAEHMMMLYASEFGVPTVSLRYFTVYGPRQRPDMAFHRWIKAGLTGEELLLFGDGEQSRDFTYIDDIVRANILAAESSVRGQVFNIGGGNQVTVNQVLQMLEEDIGKLRVNRQTRADGDAKKTSADTARAREMIGYTPQIALREGLRHEIAWMREMLAK